ncbi:MAG: dephospho-CoA kinase [Candidatus Omnitrophica bacterium]|nr:dephospho-CoA kinase [Candidatus Omnitrophota bacterium]
MVGLTGTFGSGKSTVARFFRKWGAHVISTDRLVHGALQKSGGSYRKVVKMFGRSILQNGGTVDREKLARIVFAHAAERKQLERIIHPYVFRGIRQELARTRRAIMVIEIPLLFETGFHRQVDWTVVVAASKKKILERLRLKRGWTKREIDLRMKAQMPLALKIKRSDFVIDNSNGLSKTARQAKRVWAQINQIKERG